MLQEIPGILFLIELKAPESSLFNFQCSVLHCRERGLLAAYILYIGASDARVTSLSKRSHAHVDCFERPPNRYLFEKKKNLWCCEKHQYVY